MLLTFNGMLVSLFMECITPSDNIQYYVDCTEQEHLTFSTEVYMKNIWQFLHQDLCHLNATDYNPVFTCNQVLSHPYI